MSRDYTTPEVPHSHLTHRKHYWWIRQHPWSRKSHTFDKRCIVLHTVTDDGTNMITELDSAGDPTCISHHLDDITDCSRFFGPIALPELTVDSSKQGRFA